jgi:hypothetical protein
MHKKAMQVNFPGWRERRREWRGKGRYGGTGEGERNDPNIVCTYK